jgi:hypothetical protein
MLQLFNIDVAKVDRNVAQVAMAIHVCSKCFICFRRILQVFYLGVAKIDLDVAYTSKRFRCFHTYVVSVSSRYCIYLHWLHTCFYVFSGVFVSVSNICCKCFSYFERMLQVFYLGSRGDGGIGAGHHGCVKLELLRRRPCARRGKRRGMEAGACGPMCMWAREVEGAQASGQGGAEVPAARGQL